MLHGDEVLVMGVGKIWCHSVLAFSWCSPLSVAAGRSASDAMVYVWGVFEKYIWPTTPEGMGTIDSFFELLAWSFGILFTGKWPHTKWKGQKHLDLWYSMIYFCAHVACLDSLLTLNLFAICKPYT